MFSTTLVELARDILPAAFHLRTTWAAGSCPACPPLECPQVALPACPALQCGDCSCPEVGVSSLLWASAAVALNSTLVGLAVGCAAGTAAGSIWWRVLPRGPVRGAEAPRAPPPAAGDGPRGPTTPAQLRDAFA